MEVVYPTIRTSVDEGIEDSQESLVASKGREIATGIIVIFIK
jgi:hypothetical protein